MHATRHKKVQSQITHVLRVTAVLLTGVLLVPTSGCVTSTHPGSVAITQDVALQRIEKLFNKRQRPPELFPSHWKQIELYWSQHPRAVNQHGWTELRPVKGSGTPVDSMTVGINFHGVVQHYADIVSVKRSIDDVVLTMADGTVFHYGYSLASPFKSVREAQGISEAFEYMRLQTLSTQANRQKADGNSAR